MTQELGTMPATNIQQVMELFKIQYIMKLFQPSVGKKRTSPMLAMFALIAYEHFAKQFPTLSNSFFHWAYSNIFLYVQKRQLLNDSSEHTKPPPEKKIRAYIQFERNPDAKISDPRIDAVIHHVCTMPEVKSLRFNGVEMVPNFKELLMIDNDVWFEIVDAASVISLYSGNDPGLESEQIVYKLSTFDHDIKWLHRFVEQAIVSYEQEKKNKLGSEMYYFDHLVGNSDAFRNPRPKHSVWFKKSKFNSNRTLKNVYMRQSEELKKRVDFFMKRRDWYDSKGIPHTLGIVMWGHPGCGKTSTIKAIANETKRHIFNIMLSEIKTKEELKDLFYNDTIHIYNGDKLETFHIPLHKRIYVIEDIDAMDSIVLKRTAEQLRKEEEKKLKLASEMEAFKEKQGKDMFDRMLLNATSPTDTLDLATLLNVLDGVRETPGRIIILSTNFPERLDEALLRPGRFDMMIEYEKHPRDILISHVEHFYDMRLTKEQRHSLMDPSLEKKWTPAEVSQILFKYITNLDEAVYCLCKEDPVTYFRFSNIQKDGTLVDSLPNLTITANVYPLEGTHILLEDQGKEMNQTIEKTGIKEEEIKEEIKEEKEKEKEKGEIKEEKDNTTKWEGVRQ